VTEPRLNGSAADRARGVRIALPSKGELEQPTLDFMASCGLRVLKTNPRQYSARIPALPEATVLFQRAPDVVLKVNDGSADLGITGYDLVAEAREAARNVVVLHEDLGYGRCELMLAVPDDWVDVATVADLADVAGALRTRGRPLRVATKFPNLTRAFLYRKGIAHFALVAAQGALESAPSVGYADAIADLVATGTTLRENHLKTLEGGSILKAQACLIGNRSSLARGGPALEIARVLLEYFEAGLRARGYYSVTANVRADSAEEVARLIVRQAGLAGLKGPTIAPVYPKHAGEGRWFAVNLIVRGDQLLPVIDHLRKVGASEAGAMPLAYFFDASCARYEALLEKLKRGSTVPEDEG
jgi:ATP phosphoribosyltransferase